MGQCVPGEANYTSRFTSKISPHRGVLNFMSYVIPKLAMSIDIDLKFMPGNQVFQTGLLMS